MKSFIVLLILIAPFYTHATVFPDSVNSHCLSVSIGDSRAPFVTENCYNDMIEDIVLSYETDFQINKNYLIGAVAESKKALKDEPQITYRSCLFLANIRNSSRRFVSIKYYYDGDFIKIDHADEYTYMDVETLVNLKQTFRDMCLIKITEYEDEIYARLKPLKEQEEEEDNP